MSVATNDSSKSNVNKIENKTCHKPGLLGGTILLGTLICSLPFATATSYAENFYGSGSPWSSTGQTSGSDFSGSPSGTTYNKIYGGYIDDGAIAQPVVKNNTLTLLSQHTGTKIWGGYATGGDSAEVSNNTVDFTKGTCTNSIYGAEAFIMTSGYASADANSVKLADVNFTGENSFLYGSYVFALNGGTASAEKNSLFVNNNEDGKISEIYGGYSIGYIGAETAYKGHSIAVASNNGIGEGRDGTLTNVSSTYFCGGLAAAVGGNAEAVASNNIFGIRSEGLDLAPFYRAEG